MAFTYRLYLIEEPCRKEAGPGAPRHKEKKLDALYRVKISLDGSDAHFLWPVAKKLGGAKDIQGNILEIFRLLNGVVVCEEEVRHRNGAVSMVYDIQMGV